MDLFCNEILFQILFYFDFMCMGVLFTCLSLEPAEAKRRPLELQLWMVVSHSVGAGNQTQILWMILNLLIHLSCPK